MTCSLDRWRVMTAALALAACGPQQDGADDSTGGVTSTGAPTSTTESTSTGAPTSTTESTSTGEPSTCEDPSVATSGPAVTVGLQNAGDGTIWVDHRLACAQVLPFAVIGPEDAPRKPMLAHCDFTCGDVLAGACDCALGCAGPDEVLEIQPGETIEVVWSGAHWAATAVPEACAIDCGANCLAREQAAPGKYRLIGRSSGALVGCAEDGCPCQPNESGQCVISGSRAGDELVVEVELDYPAQTAVTLVFP